MKKILFLIFVTSLMFLTACQNNPEVKTDDHAGHNNRNTNQNSAPKETGSYTAEIKTNPAQIKAGEPVEMTFTLKNPSGGTVEKVDIVHEKPMHLLIVSEDLAEFYHEHPEQQADKSFKVSFTFKNGGKYKVYSDFTPSGGSQTVKNFDVAVTGNERAKVELKADDKFEKTVDDLFVTMKPSGDLLTGKELTLDFNVMDAKTKKPVADLQKYLGELAHFVVISQDLQEFVHAHPMSAEGGHAHGSEPVKPHTEATVSAHLTFPKAGLYKVFAQFQRNNKVLTVPFVVEVRGDKAVNEPGKAVDVPKDAFRVTVSKDGFSPSEIKISKNNYTKLAFVRTDTENCANEVVFKSLNMTKKLPLNEVVLVDLPQNFTGELNFACGMDMYKGKVIAE